MNDQLEARLARLERMNRRLTVALTSVIGFAALAFFTGAGEKPAQTIEAREFILKDIGGKRRATLGMALGSPALTLTDAKGETRLSLKVTGEEPSVLLTGPDEAGKLFITLGSNASGLMLTGSDQNDGISLMNSREAGAGLVLRANGASLSGMVDRDGGLGFELKTKEGRKVTVP